MTIAHSMMIFKVRYFQRNLKFPINHKMAIYYDIVQRVILILLCSFVGLHLVGKIQATSITFENACSFLVHKVM